MWSLAAAGSYSLITDSTHNYVVLTFQILIKCLDDSMIIQIDYQSLIVIQNKIKNRKKKLIFILKILPPVH